jgi:hypothetical protein
MYHVCCQLWGQFDLCCVNINHLDDLKLGVDVDIIS